MSTRKPSATAIIAHKLGHREETTVTLPHDVSGSKNAVQGIGSAISYAERYALRAALNLASRASQDDDGNAAGTIKLLSQEQIEFIQQRLIEVVPDPIKSMDRLLRTNKVATIEQIPASKYDEIIQTINQFEKDKKVGK
jgi:hypothetical protein